MTTTSRPIKIDIKYFFTNILAKEVRLFAFLFLALINNLYAQYDELHRRISNEVEKTHFQQKYNLSNLAIPITTLKPLKYKNFTNLWICDESGNPTGTHKDRFAQSVLHLYKIKIMATEDRKIPQASIISAGSSAIAIQACLRKHNLPNLKVLVDHNTSDSIVSQMKDLGCEVYKTDLGVAMLEPQDILRLTNNNEGFDITFEGKHKILSCCYSDLAADIISQQPDYIFIPYGSGLLYHNFFVIVKDSRLLNPPCLLGATVTSPASRAKKLYSPYKSWPTFIKSVNNQSIESDVYDITDDYILLAEEILQENGFKVEPSAAAGLALLLRFENSLPKDKKIIVINTGMARVPYESFKLQKTKD